MTDHRLRCSASPQYQSRDLFVRKIPLPHRYNQITPFLCAPRNLYFLHFHHIIPHFYLYSNIPIHIVESDTNITTPTNHDVGDKRYFDTFDTRLLRALHSRNPQIIILLQKHDYFLLLFKKVNIFRYW